MKKRDNNVPWQKRKKKELYGSFFIGLEDMSDLTLLQGTFILFLYPEKQNRRWSVVGRKREKKSNFNFF